jgi:hypothetical protein
MAGLYVESGHIACYRKRINVYVNGKHVAKCIRAKSGKNGFVEFAVTPIQIKGDNFLLKKIRGNVKISMSPR